MIALVKDAIWDAFLPELFGGREPISVEFCHLLLHSVQQSGIRLRNPVDAALSFFEVSRTTMAALVYMIRNKEDLDLVTHFDSVKGAREKTQRIWVELEQWESAEYGSKWGKHAQFRLKQTEASGE